MSRLAVVVPRTNTPSPAHAASPETNTRAIFLVASPHPPYAVYANPFYKHASHINVFSVSPTPPLSPASSERGGSTDAGPAYPGGRLTANIQNELLAPTAGVHGAVVCPPVAPLPVATFPDYAPPSSYAAASSSTETSRQQQEHQQQPVLYSADMHTNCLWAHTLSPSTGLITGLVARLPSPDADDHPRWVAAHPSGRYLYSLTELTNVLREYVVDPATRRPVYTGHSFSLLPKGVTPRDRDTGKLLYRGDNCAVSSSGRWLFASTRSNRPTHRAASAASSNVGPPTSTIPTADGLPGYVTVFRLRESSGGSIVRQVLQVPTRTSGGHSNAVSPCPWNDAWVALTDDDEGSLEILRFVPPSASDEDDDVWAGGGGNGEGAKLESVARVLVAEPGFGMNAIWYD